MAEIKLDNVTSLVIKSVIRLFPSLIKVIRAMKNFDHNMTALELIFYYLKYSTLFTLPGSRIIPPKNVCVVTSHRNLVIKLVKTQKKIQKIFFRQRVLYLRCDLKCKQEISGIRSHDGGNQLQGDWG